MTPPGPADHPASALSAAIALLLATLFAGMLALFPICSFDIWWHLRTGRLIVEELRIPHTDPFTYTAGGNHWVTHEWLAETLFYDAEYGLYGSISLIDTELEREAYLAAYDSTAEVFQIEKATAWEKTNGGEDDDFGYAIAVDGKILAEYKSSVETADALLDLVDQEGNLAPGFVPEVEED